MTRHPTPRLAELLDGLEEVFQKEGFRKVTISELAARMCCSRRTLYEVAASKEEIFVVILGRLLARIRAMGDEALEAGTSDPGAQLEAFLTPGFTQTLNASTAFFADIESLPAARRMMEQHQAARVERVRRIIEGGVRRGRLRRVSPYLVSEVGRVVARRLKEPEFLREASLSAGEAFREWTRILLYGLLQPTGDEKPRRKRTRRR
jgi:AcrR family transcriptional regulator